MITRKSRRYLFAKWLRLVILMLLLVLFALVALFLAGYWEFNNKLAKPVNPDKDIISNLTLADLKLTTDGELTEILERPLFMSTRRPPAAVVDTGDATAGTDEPAKEEVKPLTEKLSSIIIVDGKKTAFLEGKGTTIKLEEGMSYNGWTVVSIESDQIEVSDGSNSKTLTLRTFAVSLPTEPRRLGKADASEKKK